MPTPLPWLAPISATLLPPARSRAGPGAPVPEAGLAFGQRWHRVCGPDVLAVGADHRHVFLHRGTVALAAWAQG